jgi:aryl carrier-like protein
MTDGLRQWLRDPDRWLQLLTLAAGLTAFVLGFHEYRQEQRWKRLETFTQLLQSLEAEPEVRTALEILEYNQPRVCARDDAGEGPRCFVATDSLVMAALDGSMRARALTPEEHQVVYGLDRFLAGLDRIEYLQAQGFVAEEARHPTIAYWISLVGDRRNRAKPARVRAELCQYVRFFEYEGALRLVARYTEPRYRVAECTAPATGRESR